jgi:glutamyl-tRNA reductase
MGEKEKEAIEYMATAIMNKLIHPPTAALKGDVENKEMLVAAIRRLYGINGEKNDE